MARMIPNLSEQQLATLKVKNSAEHDAYIALRDQTPSEWVARYDFVYSLKEGGDGQADFIVLVPNCGLMFFEVKGPAGFESKDGQCYWVMDDGSLGRQPAEDPFGQAQKNKHTIVERLAKRLGVEKRFFPGRYAHLVAFPRARRRGQLPPLSHEPQHLLLYEDMPRVKLGIEEAFKVFGFDWVGQKFNSTVFSQIEQTLTGDVLLAPAMAAEMDDENRLITALTQQQEQAYSAVINNTRIRVEGVAGSGKTLIAKWAAERFAKVKGRTLFLRYNRLLAAWLNAGPAKKGGFEAWTFHGLARHCCNAARIEFKASESTDLTGSFWKQIAPICFAEALEQDELRGFRYDAIVVDEAQDFLTDWWVPVEMLLKDAEESPLHLFLDPSQCIYGALQPSIKTDSTYRLDENCRNTRLITNYCGQIIERRIPGRPGIPEGVEPTIHKAEQALKKRTQRVREIVQQWLDEKVTPDRIAILSPWATDNAKSTLANLPQIGSIAVADRESNISDWMEGRVLLGTTTKAFKGMEADCVVITDVPISGVPGFEVADLYVASSRAKLRLELVPESVAAEKQLNQWLGQADSSSVV